MAITSLSMVFLKPPVTLYHSKTRNRELFETKSWFPARPKSKPTSLSIITAHSSAQNDDIVIVGAGIAGLATAVSLHRLDVRRIKF